MWLNKKSAVMNKSIMGYNTKINHKGTDYYYRRLNSQKLFQVYDTAITGVKRYLNEEINFVRGQLLGSETLLEVGTGYGRILKELASSVKSAVGIDISYESIDFGKEYLKNIDNVTLQLMDAHTLTFKNKFDRVLCLQNGLSSLKGDPLNLMTKCMESLVKDGLAYFSTYSEKFWELRLSWFEEQASKGLIGEIDKKQTKDGVIVCKDGFRAITFTKIDLMNLGNAIGYPFEIKEIDNSVLFIIIRKAS
jgi:2-polyprenyl-6-hydroxyphenyl methylase/3-demethylubiquinone-9 3-methyltransferase